MNARKLRLFARLAAVLAPALAFLLLPATTARANVYATDITINGSLFGVTNLPTPAHPAVITYHLNQAATLGCTVAIVNGGATVATIAAPANFGSNSVSWGGTNNLGAPVSAGGAYGINITAAAADVSVGSGNWTQISIDGTNTAVVFPQGMDVDRNTNSPYYGRVVVGNAVDGTLTQFTPNVTQLDGLYKYNADSTPADEGSFGYANYTTNDSGNVGFVEPGQEMSSIGGEDHDTYCPLTVRVGSDDRIYFSDCSDEGAIVACDMLATTNQIVICEGPGNGATGLPASGGYPNCLNNYANNPQGGNLNDAGIGWYQFDVAGFETGNPAVYLCDFGDYPNCPGTWMYHLINGAADPADTTGTSCVNPDNNYIEVVGSGIMVDTNLDLYFGQERSNPSDAHNRVFLYSNWYGGVLPPEGNGSNYTYSVPSKASDSAPTWDIGGGSYLCDIADTVINSRLNPTLVAVAMESEVAGYPSGGVANNNAYDGHEGGVAILSAADGSPVVTNLDDLNWYSCVAFDNVGNVYAASITANVWRVWSPPEANTNTTLAVAQFVVPMIQITGATVTPEHEIFDVPVGGTCYNVTINFTVVPATLPLSGFVLMGSGAVNGQFTPVGGAAISQISPGVYQATATVCSGAQYFVVAFQ